MSDRARRDGQLRGTSHYDGPAFLAALQESYDFVWEILTANVEGYGQQSTTLLTTADQSWVNLPADFLDLRLIQRAVGSRLVQLERSSREREEFMFAGSSRKHKPGVYWLEGPVQPATFGQRIELRPVPTTTAEAIPITYVTQGPQWADDTVQLDLLSEHVERAVIDLAVQRLSARDDATAMQRAEVRAKEALRNLSWVRDRRDSAGPNSVSRYQAGWRY